LPIGSWAFNGCGNNVPETVSCTIVGTYASQFLTLARNQGGLPERWTASA
jgi:hypothetical protein